MLTNEIPRIANHSNAFTEAFKLPDFYLPEFEFIVKSARTFNVPSIALLRLRSAIEMRDTISRTDDFAVFEFVHIRIILGLEPDTVW